jgi:hypothetical protein
MTKGYFCKTQIVVCAVVLGAALLGPATGAMASDASIRAVLKSYSSRILISEGHVVTAIGEFKKSGNPNGVQAALKRATGVLSSLKSKIAAQSASSRRVKEGKAKLENGLGAVIGAYRHLKTAFGEKQSSPQTAKAEAKKALRAIKQGASELREGAKLLK